MNMNNFFLNAITPQYVSELVKEFLEKDFPRLQKPKDWKYEYFMFLEEIMTANPLWGAASYFKNAEITFVATFKTVLGQALARVVLHYKEKPMQFSYLMFSEANLCSLIMRAKEKTLEEISANDTNNDICAVASFEAVLCKEMKTYFEECRNFNDQLENSTKKSEIPQEAEQKSEGNAENAKSLMKKDEGTESKKEDIPQKDESTESEKVEIPKKDEGTESKKEDVSKKDEGTESKHSDIPTEHKKRIDIVQALVRPWMSPVTGLVFVVSYEDSIYFV